MTNGASIRAIRTTSERVLTRIGVLLPALVTGLTVLLVLHRLDDSDTWWHLASGRWIALHGAVQRTDPFSYTAADHPWINVQWLYDLFLYGLYRTGGVDWLILSAALGYGVAVALLIKNVRRFVGPVAASVIALWVIVIAQERFMIRPEMMSFIFLEVIIGLVTSARADQGRRLWLLIPVMALWANIHSLFIVGLVFIGCHVASAVLTRASLLPRLWRRPAVTSAVMWRMLLYGAMAILVTVVNPYGFDGALFPLKLLSRISGSVAVFQNIDEFRSPFSGFAVNLAVRAYQGFLMVTAVIVTMAGLEATRSGQTEPPPLSDPSSRIGTSDGRSKQWEGPLDIAGLLFFVMLAYLSLLARRNMALFAFGAAPFVGECLLVLGSRLPSALRKAGDIASIALPALMLPVILAASWLVVSNRLSRWDQASREFGLGILEADFPIRAVAFAREMKLPPRLFNDLTSGAYLNWDAPVEGGVYIDGRLEVYDAALFSSYMAVVSDPSVWQAEVDRRDIRTVLLDYRWDQRYVLFDALRNDPRWALVYFDEMAVVFVRRDGVGDLAKIEARFATLDEETRKRLLEPVGSWQWPAGRILALWNYGTVSARLGHVDAAASCYTRLLELDLPAALEEPIRLRLGAYFTGKGERAAALTHLRRAAILDPGSAFVARLLAQNGG